MCTLKKEEDKKSKGGRDTTFKQRRVAIFTIVKSLEVRLSGVRMGGGMSVTGEYGPVMPIDVLYR